MRDLTISGGRAGVTLLQPDSGGKLFATPQAVAELLHGRFSIGSDLSGMRGEFHRPSFHSRRTKRRGYRCHGGWQRYQFLRSGSFLRGQFLQRLSLLACVPELLGRSPAAVNRPIGVRKDRPGERTGRYSISGVRGQLEDISLTCIYSQVSIHLCAKFVPSN